MRRRGDGQPRAKEMLMFVGIRDQHVVFALRFGQEPVLAGTGELVSFQCLRASLCAFKKV